MPRDVYYTDGNREEHLYTASYARQTLSKHSTGADNGFAIVLSSDFDQQTPSSSLQGLFDSLDPMQRLHAIFFVVRNYLRGARPSHPPEMGWLIFPRQVYLSEVPTRSQTAVMTEL
jgi:hypothetical protein